MGSTTQLHGRSPHIVILNLDLSEPDTIAPSGTEPFHKRFLSRKPSGIVHRRMRLYFTVGNFQFRKHPFAEPGRAGQFPLNSCDVEMVNSDSDYHRDSPNQA
jgi:hypothetical protein